MKQCVSIESVRELVWGWKLVGESVALVPTMGNLHAGHLSLVEAAKDKGQRVVVSVFINPLQFAPHEDFTDYPRTVERDLALLDGLGVDAVFLPLCDDLVPVQAHSAYVCEPLFSAGLCGASRPHFFQGVATIVCKLFNIVQPDMAFFGEKDYQQLLVIKKMVADLNFPIIIHGMAIVRESDGLALSSRNAYLGEQLRTVAPSLYQCLQDVAALVADGEMDYQQCEMQGKQQLRQLGFDVDYLSVRRAEDLTVPDDKDSDLIVLVAAKLGDTRLIDNFKFSCDGV